MRLFSSITAAALKAAAAIGSLAIQDMPAPSSGQPSVERLRQRHPTNNRGQYRNPGRARQRKLTRQLGGRRQYLKTMKALRRHRAGLVAAGYVDARGGAAANQIQQAA